MRKIFFILFFCALLAGCGQKKEDIKPAVASETAQNITVVQPTTEETTETTTVDEIASQMAKMSLDEKLCQLFIVDIGNADDELKINCRDGSVWDLNDKPLGGYIYFTEDIKGVAGTCEFTQRLKKLGNIQPFIAVDEEGGAVSRIASSGAVSDYYIPSAKTLAKGGREEVVKNYTYLAKTIFAMGFNMDFAPDADVDTNPENPIIGDRAFSSDPETAADMAAAAADALKNNGIIPVVKHFPGHGDTETDSHSGLAAVPHGRQRLDTVELVPFKKAIENGVPVIMAGHLTVPALSQSDKPASLNKDIITGLLREELGFDGVVVTDAMNMEAVTDIYGDGDAAVAAIDAGVDIILMTPDIQTAFNALKTAVGDGRLTEKRINASVYRILSLKESYLK